MNGQGVTARIDCTCGYCKGEVSATDKHCRHCGARLVCDSKYDKLDSYAKEYAAERG